MGDSRTGRPVRRLLVVMDPIGAIHPDTDSTLAMLLEAQRRDWSVQYAEIIDLLTEINVTSTTGIRELERDAGHRVAATLFDAFETRLGGSG
jgi:glutathione synthase/RimK-type ligase-like ATP-grasp enzyme